MKKTLALLLCALLLGTGLAGCAQQAEQPAQEATPVPTAETTPAPQPTQEAGLYTPGTYTGTASGFGGEVSVTIEVDASSILSVTAAGASETAGIGSNAIDQLPAAMLEAQGSGVDGVSGATVSSTAVKLAMDNALAAARGRRRRPPSP